MKLPIILASSSPSRLKLLKQIHIIPDEIIPADIDEAEHKGESARQLAYRLAFEKSNHIASKIPSGIIIGADTVPVCSRKILRKAQTREDIIELINLLEGRRHQLYSGVCIIKKVDNKIVNTKRFVTKTIIKFRPLKLKEIEYYAGLGEGIGKAGGYDLNGYGDCFVSFMSGSYSNVIGMPLDFVAKTIAAMQN